jgi:hypothetical protein
MRYPLDNFTLTKKTTKYGTWYVPWS